MDSFPNLAKAAACLDGQKYFLEGGGYSESRPKNQSSFSPIGNTPCIHAPFLVYIGTLRNSATAFVKAYTALR
jgi:hypothetical protein